MLPSLIYIYMETFRVSPLCHHHFDIKKSVILRRLGEYELTFLADYSTFFNLFLQIHKLLRCSFIVPTYIHLGYLKNYSPLLATSIFNFLHKIFVFNKCLSSRLAVRGGLHRLRRHRDAVQRTRHHCHRCLCCL